MKKGLYLLAILFLTVPLWAGHRRYFRSADDINSGTLNSARLDASSVTLRGSQPVDSQANGSPQGAFNTINWGNNLTPALSNGIVTVDATGGGGTSAISTGTLSTLTAHYAVLSTVSLTGFAGGFDTTGFSTYAVMGVYASALAASTVAITRVTVVTSTGINGLPVQTTRFPTIDIPTATATNQFISLYITTSVVLLPNTHFGLQVTSTAVSGTATRGLKLRLRGTVASEDQ